MWIAQFKDGTILRQYEGEKENLFKGVLDRVDELEVFNLVNTKTNKAYRLNLFTGVLNIIQQGTFMRKPEPELTTKRKLRLIFFRRMEKNMGFSGTIESSGEPTLIAYFLGYQYNDDVGKNHKLLVQIHEDDQIFISSI